MDILVGRDEKIRRLERAIKDLEKKTEKNFENIGHSFDTFKSVVLKLQEENEGLKKDRDFLLEKYKEVVRQLGSPVKDALEENAKVFRDALLEDIGGKNIDDLFELIMKSKRLSAIAAARKLEVAEDTVKTWAARLEKKGLIDFDKQGVMKKKT